MMTDGDLKITKEYLENFATSINARIEFSGEAKEIRTTGMINMNTLIPGKLVCLWDISYFDSVKKDKGITAIMTSYEIFDKIKDEVSQHFMILIDKLDMFWKLHNAYATEKGDSKKKEKSLPECCKIAESAIIAPDVIIGENCRIAENVVIKDNVIIGNNVIIKAGVVIGEEGAEVKQIDGKLVQIAHEKSVIIGDNVNIGASAIIEKGVYGLDTVIGENSIVGAGVYIPHCTQIGRQVFITPGVVIGGSCVIEDNVYIGLGAIIKNNIKISKDSFVSMGATVTNNVPPKTKVVGFQGRMFPI